jgi:hypothetical protein
MNVLAVTMGHSTGYADVGPVLADLLANARGTLAPHLVGVSLDLLARGEGESAGELLRADADEAELAVPGILAVVEKGQE